ncbi:sulfatase family protein [Marinoscillum furvescens]|uniref:Arylsulfatase A-like enzyme n=1 Tax=Marinoscillum furvescens DSM 4134 TaxID=1122208 RepID=A0A3D9L5Q1_MARFU|nr:arylsulfatase [Marinoscillum furvescens]REE00144.1 arylsulfatase A-like enzyme [Marinoscillum furvescens DSM 4134]
MLPTKVKINYLQVFTLNVVLLILSLAFVSCDSPRHPNIIYIICDDLGYGDVHALAPETSRISTPHADQLAGAGMVFTDAHSGSSVCTPTRYGVLTGRYSWRTRLQRGVVQGYADNLIAPERATVASHLKELGYHTAILGKWHLNFQYQDPETGQFLEKPKRKPFKAPVGTEILDGPLTRGFDYYYGFHHAGSMQEVIENTRVISHEPEINMLPTLTRKSVAYIHERAKDKDTPFFLYLPLGSPHTPIVPSAAWQGKSGLGKYGDFVMETDNVIGEVVKALEANGLDENTLIIFTSDNGCSKAAGIPELAQQGHLVSAHMRGSKADLWDGGHRVPFIVSWPGKVQAGSVSDELICLTDLFATVADITQTELPATGAEDSFSFLPALYGKPIESERKGVIHHSISGHFAYRQGKWKLLLAKGSGGWTAPREKDMPEDAPAAQLYDLYADPGETKNLFESRPEVVDKLLKDLKSDIAMGHTRRGILSDNDLEEITLWKSGAPN